MGKRVVFHALLHLKTTGCFGGLVRDGLVNVGGHDGCVSVELGRIPAIGFLALLQVDCVYRMGYSFDPA